MNVLSKPAPVAHRRFEALDSLRGRRPADGRWKLRTPPQCRHRKSACANLELYDLRHDPLEERLIQVGKLAPAQRRQALDARARMEKFALANGLAS